MKGLKKFKADHYASDFTMGMFLGVGEDYYKKMEKLDEEDVPPAIRERFNATEELSNKITDYYKRQEEFFMNTDLVELMGKANKSVDDVSNETLISPEIVKSCLFEGMGFPNNNIKDKLIDYSMFIDGMVKTQGNQTMMAEPVQENIPSEDLNIPDLPEIPTVENQPEVDHEFDKKDAEIAGLNRQLDWYEQIIDTFSKLVNLASKGN